jgi:catalase
MDDHDHPELGFDPLDDTKVWPEHQFPPKPVGRMVLDRNASNVFAETSRSRSARACPSTRSTCPATRCS